MVKSTRWSLLFLACFLIGQCGDDGGGNGPDPIFENMHLDLFTVAPLPDAVLYEVWASPIPQGLAASIEDWESLGRFNVELDGETRLMVTSTGSEIANNDLNGLDIDLADFDSLFVTIEPDPDNDPLPSGVIYLLGDLNLPGNSIVAVGFPESNFRNNLPSSVWFTLATPTDSDTANELSGVWLMLSTGESGFLGNPLQAPPEGWIYEGWAVVDDIKLSFGRFYDVTMADLDGNPYGADELPAPGYPGEDFLTNSPFPGVLDFPLVIDADDEIAITLEPDTGWDPADPFPYAIYIVDRSAGNFEPGPFKNYQFDRQDEVDDAYPLGNVTITRPD